MIAIRPHLVSQHPVVVAGGRGKGPGTVTVLRAQLVEHHMDDQVDWSEIAEAATKIAAFARSRQRQAWQRIKSWDPEPAA